jgi:hypothetical protein
MNTTIRNLIVALPLAAAAVTMAPSVAMADTGDITQPLPGGDPQGPVIGIPTPHQDPTGPGDLTAPQPCPTHGVDCGGNGGGNGGHGDGGQGGHKGHQGGNGGHHKPGTTVASIALPTRIDAGLAPAAAPVQDEQGLELSWLLAGGAVVTASGAAFAARRVRARA